jgi:nicotinate phosphoribosyltransferase
MSKSAFDFVDPTSMSMLTDFYELTMCASYYDNQKTEQATFDLFIRRLPPNRSYFIFAGLEQALQYVKNIKFTQQHLAYLKKQGLKQNFLTYLKTVKFTGEVWAVPEGTIIFPEEPLIRVTAPIIEAQLIETFLLNTVNIQTTLATKASRVTTAANGKPIIEFGLRRTQGTDAGMKAARASYIAGANGTSNVLAGMHYGIPVYGTMAHSYIMLHNTEIDAFRAFTKTFPQNSTLLIDTYDNQAGAKNAAKTAKEMEKQGHKLRAVRLDSGNLLTISKQARQILDQNQLQYVKIFASGDLDEYKIAELEKQGAKIDSYGVGTRMSTSFDRPYVDVVYKLSCKEEKGTFTPAMKLSKRKVTLPGRKQIFRQKDRQGKYLKDIIGLEDEKIKGERLLIRVMQDGEITYHLPSLQEIRKNCLRNLAELPEKYKKLENAPHYPVQLSPQLKKIKQQLTKQITIEEHKSE